MPRPRKQVTEVQLSDVERMLLRGLGVRRVAQRTGTPRRVVERERARLGLTPRRSQPWTDAQRTYLRDHAGEQSVTRLAREVSRIGPAHTEGAVRVEMSRLGLSACDLRTDLTVTQVAELVGRSAPASGLVMPSARASVEHTITGLYSTCRTKLRAEHAVAHLTWEGVTCEACLAPDARRRADTILTAGAVAETLAGLSDEDCAELAAESHPIWSQPPAEPRELDPLEERVAFTLARVRQTGARERTMRSAYMGAMVKRVAAATFLHILQCDEAEKAWKQSACEHAIAMVEHEKAQNVLRERAKGPGRDERGAS